MPRFNGIRNHRRFKVTTIPAKKEKRRCLSCDRFVRRSWRTGLLHPRCFTCRYLVMIYGTSIKVSYVEE